MGISREVINRQTFKALMMDIFSLYRKKLADIKIADQDAETYEVILDHENKEILNPRRGYGKHIFARKDTPEYYYSIGAVISTELERINKKPEVDLSDFLYKKTQAYKNNESEIEVYNTFFEILEYNSIKDYCADKKDLDYDASATLKYRKSAKNKNNERTARLENRLTGNWRLYFYNNEGFGNPSFASATLKINDLSDIKLTNTTTDSSVSYTGKIDDSVTKIAGVVYLKFTPVNKWVNRNLRIALHVSEDMHIELAIGQYTNIDSGAHLIRGSVCMEIIKEGEFKKNKKPSIDTISSEFRSFLADKTLNFNRLPNNQYNLISFRSWLGEQKAKLQYQRTQKIQENKKLFISSPINSVNAHQFQELKEIVEKIEKHFMETEDFIKVNSFIKELEHQKDKSSIPDRIEYQSVMEMFNECSYYMAIWPLNLQLSGIIFEIGWAVMTERPVVIFEQVHAADDTLAKSQIPHLLRGGCGAKGSGIERYTFDKFDEIMNILRTNALSDIFINPRSRD